jgi:hypothetical protein
MVAKLLPGRPLKDRRNADHRHRHTAGRQAGRQEGSEQTQRKRVDKDFCHLGVWTTGSGSQTTPRAAFPGTLHARFRRK